jgi:hypothetical protein
MNNTKKSSENFEIKPEYKLDYKRAKPNRFSPRLMPIDEDVAKVFSTPEMVNTALRTIITIIPRKTKGNQFLQKT